MTEEDHDKSQLVSQLRFKAGISQIQFTSITVCSEAQLCHCTSQYLHFAMCQREMVVSLCTLLDLMATKMH
jgi:hypothetical protein